ncbi:MAG TPA: ATP-binding protein [Buttiauxella sp.]|jgi:hypothetical protein
MTTLRELTIEEVADILTRGTFAELISAVEHVQFECKGGLYDTKVVKSKIELAKDISALANSNGGYLLIGPATTKNPLHQGDEVSSVSEFGSSLFHSDTYRDILNAFIYPPIADLKIQWHPSCADPAKGIASIYVPPKSSNEKPFLVAQSELDSQVRGHMFGYFERVGDDALPTTVQIIRDTMKDGKRYGDLERRMESLESLLMELISDRSVKENPITSERLLQRAADAKIAAQLLDVPSFYLLAAPRQPMRLSGLFSSKSAEYKAINEPPAYREHGFDLNPHTPVQYVRGELIRRVTNGKKGLELWQDGTLIFVGRNDEDFLGWAVPRKEENLYINNYVLTEVVSLFLVLTIDILRGAQEPPKRVGVCFGFMREDAEAANYELSSHPIDRVYGSFGGKKVPAENRRFWIDFELKDATPEVEALKLLKEIYHWFGITDEQIPYVDAASVPERVERARYA